MKTVFWLRPLLAMLLAGVVCSAHAVIGSPGTNFGNGDFKDIPYGALSDGNVFSFSALLFPGGTLATQQVAQRVATLPDFAFDASGIGPKNIGTSLAEFDFKVTNVGAVVHNDLRFMVTIGADGNPNNFLESVAETWGAAAPGDPTRRQTIDWGATGNDLNARLDVVWANNNGAPGPDGAGVPASCKAPGTCDSYVGLQWDVATLKPGESFLVRVGLSDNGQHLSSRFLTLTADPADGINNALTFSGLVQIVPVPEPSSLAMLVAGLAVMGGLAWHRRARS